MTYHATILTTGGQRYYIAVPTATSEDEAREWIRENLADVLQVVAVFGVGEDNVIYRTEEL